jgi:hypothetical protein
VQDRDDLLNFSFSMLCRGCLRQIRALHVLNLQSNL